MRSAPCFILAWSLFGCYSTSRYDTPATLPPRKAQVTAALEGGRVHRERVDPRFGVVADRREFLVLTPTTSVRVGVAEGIEVGGTFGPSRLTAETKFRLMDRLAFAPGGGLLGDVVLVDAPLLAGAQLHERLELVLSPGISWATAPGESDAIRPEGLFLRAGFVARLRVFGPLSLVPEVTTMTSATSPRIAWTTAGLGFQLRPLP